MLQIKKATAQDLNTVQQLNHQIMDQNINFDSNINPDFDLQPEGKKYFEDAISDKEGIFLIAYEENLPIGYVNGTKKEYLNRSIKTFEIENLGVIKEKRRSGIAKALFNVISTKAKEQGYKRVYLNCYYKNTIALEFYKKLGFEPIDISMEKNI